MRVFAASLFVLLCVSTTATAEELPPDIAYRFYVSGKPAGRSVITVERNAGRIELASRTDVQFMSFSMSYSCRTVADANTGLVESFTYDGARGGETARGDAVVGRNEIVGHVYAEETDYAKGIPAPPYPLVFIEDYIIEHEILLALAHLSSGDKRKSYSIFSPSQFTTTSGWIERSGELEIENDQRAMVCTKLTVTHGSNSWISYVDPARMLPVYLAFPSLRMEVFLEEFYGTTPTPRFPPQ